MCRLSWNLGASTSWNPQDLSRPVMGLFYLYLYLRCTDFSNLFLEWNSICFGQFLCQSSGVFHCTHSNGICEQDQDGVPSWSCLQAVSKPVWHIPLLCVQWKTPDIGQKNCPKHVEFHSKNKFEKLVHLIGFIIRNITRCTVTWMANILCTQDHL